MHIVLILLLVVQSSLTAILLYVTIATHIRLSTIVKDNVCRALYAIRKTLDDHEAHRIEMMAREAQIRLEAGPGEGDKAEAAIDAARVTEGQALEIKRQECARPEKVVKLRVDPWLLK